MIYLPLVVELPKDIPDADPISSVSLMGNDEVDEMMDEQLLLLPAVSMMEPCDIGDINGGNVRYKSPVPKCRIPRKSSFRVRAAPPPHDYLLFTLINLGIDADGVQYVGHLLGVDAAVVGHVLLTPLVDVHVAG